MTIQTSRKWLLTAGLLGAVAAAPAWAAKDAVIAVGSNFTTLDPYDANDTLSQAVAKSFYQGLFGFDKDMKLVNVLAESYQASPDGLTWTIKLRSGIKFQDGTDFNAEAVKVNLDRASDEDNHLKRYNLFKHIATTEVIDPTTVKITLKQPFSAFINILAHPAAAMISPTALKKYGKEIGFHPVGTGPYEFVTWNQTDFVKVKKWDGYWKKGYPKLDSITWRPIVDNNTRANVTQKPFDNPKVREAINYAINRRALTKVAFAGYATPATGIVPPSIEYAQSYPPFVFFYLIGRDLIKYVLYTIFFITTL